MKRFVCLLLAAVLVSAATPAVAAPKKGASGKRPAKVARVAKTKRAAKAVRATKATRVYIARLAPLNNSGVTGIAIIRVKEGTMTVQVVARGLEPNQVHMQHIHGFAGETTNSVCPPASAAGEDGILTLQEGLPFYGPVMLPLDPYPTASATGIYTYKRTFDSVSAVSPLHLRTVVVHGMTVNGTYDPTLPVACAEIGMVGKRKGWSK